MEEVRKAVEVAVAQRDAELGALKLQNEQLRQALANRGGRTTVDPAFPGSEEAHSGARLQEASFGPSDRESGG